MSDPNPKTPIERLLAHAGWVRRLGRSLLTDPNQVDDAVQETWVAALEHRPETVTNDRAWLGGVFRNVLRQRQRTDARRSRRESDSARAETLPAADDLVERAELQEKILQAVLRLKEPYRSTLLLRYFEELSAEEIARREGVPSSTVRNRHKRALALLREEFGLDEDDVRRKWALLLVPLGPSVPLPLTPDPSGVEEIGHAVAESVTAGTTVSASTTSTGVLAMSLKALAATALVVSIGWGTSFAYRQVSEQDTSQDSQTTPAAVMHEPTSELASSAELTPAQPPQAAAPRATRQATQPEARKVIEVDEAPPIHVVRGRVVDPKGAPLAGIRVFVGGRPSPFDGPSQAGLQLTLERANRDLDRKRREEQLRELELYAEQLRRQEAENNATPGVEAEEIERERAVAAEKLKKHHAELEARKEHAAREKRAPRQAADARSRRQLAELESKRAAMLAENVELKVLAQRDPRKLEVPIEDDEHLEKFEKSAAHLTEVGAVVGRILVTDDEGFFACDFPGARNVYVTLFATDGVLPRQLGGWHQTPVEDLSLTAQILPTASFSVTVRDETTGMLLPHWIGVLHLDQEPVIDWNVEGAFEHTLELPSEERTTYQVSVREPQWAHATTTIELNPGDERDVEILVRSGQGVVGAVVDTFGQPVQGAAVYGGDWTGIRGNTIFGTYEPERLFEVARTTADGTFRLPGEATWVTVWHPDHSAATVHADQAGLIRLEARGAITGRLPFEAPVHEKLGVPVVFLDREEGNRAEIDESGFFRFDNVEAGVHGVQLAGGAFLGVEVQPGQTTHVTWDDILPAATVELESGGAPLQGSLNGYIARLGDVFTQDPFWAASKGGYPMELRFERQQRGTFVLYTNEGSVTQFDLLGERAVADLGTATLTVQGTPGEAVYLVPEPLVHAPIVVRIATLFPRELNAEGTTTFGPLPIGRYVVGVRGQGFAVHTAVDGPGSSVSLP